MRTHYVSTKTGFKFRTCIFSKHHLEIQVEDGRWVPALGRDTNLPSTMKNLVPQTHPVIKGTILVVVTLSVIISLGATL